MLEAWNFGFRKKRCCTIQVAKTKALISFAVTAKLICVFIFAYAKRWFSHDAAQIIFIFVWLVVILLYGYLHTCDFLCQLEKAKEEIKTLKKKCDECDQEITRLKSDLKKMSGDYGKIATRSRIVSTHVLVCLPFRKSLKQIELIYQDCCLKIMM